MARLTGPLFSLRASGSIADTLVYARWKGIEYVRVHVVPTNPNTTDQQEVRGVFATLSEMWKRMPYFTRQPFELAARGLPLTDRNVHVRENVAALQGDANLNDLVMSVGGGQALPPDNVVTADGADGTATITADAPTMPSGWTLSAVVGAAVLDGDPSPVLIRTTYWISDGAAPYSMAVDVPADGTYQIGVWCSFVRDSDGLVFCSADVRSQVVVSGN